MFDSLYFREHTVRNDWHSQMSFHPKAREATSCFIDANSFLRNGTSTVSALTPLAATAFVAASATVGGALGIPIGLAIVRDGCKKIKAAAQVGDIEGVVQQGLWVGGGATYAGLSSLLVTEGAMTLQGAAVPAAITPAFGFLGLSLYGCLLAYGAHGLLKTAQFHSDLKSVLKKEGDAGALQWLSDQVSLNEDEAQDPDKAKILQRKWNRFELRTNPQCAALVREKLPKLMKHYDPVEARELIRTVEKATFKEKVKHILLIVISILGIAASLCVLFLTGPAAPLLFAIGALVWLTVDNSRLHNYIGEKCWSWYSKKEPELEEDQIPCLSEAS